MEILKRIFKRKTEYEEEKSAREQIVAIYTVAESHLPGFIRELQNIKYKYGLRSVDMAEDTLGPRDIANSLTNSHLTKLDQLTRSAEERILGHASIQNPTKRDTIHKEALMAARNYWLDLLEKPNLSNDVWMFGQSRLAQISGKLERHSGSSEQQ